ncbi:MAG: hypothetical protein OHK0012_07640 [Synechococcales cyanobacterium]
MTLSKRVGLAAMATTAAVVATMPWVAFAKPFEVAISNPVLPRAITVDPVLPPQNAQLQVWLDRRGNNPRYAPGEAITILVQPNRDAYVYLYSVEANGQVKLIVPNSYAQAATYVRAGQTFAFPPAGAPFRLTVTPPYGRAAVFALAAPRPLSSTEVSYLERPGTINRLAQGDKQVPNLNQLVNQPITVTPYGTVSQPSIQRIQVDPVPTTPSWFTGIAYYQVRR